MRALKRPMMAPKNNTSGILLVDKKRGSTSFHLVALLRRLTKIAKIGHAGTLDPFATGLMVMLIGRDSTKQSNQFLNAAKEYQGILHLGVSTDTYDIEGKIQATSDKVPTLEEIEQAVAMFQGESLQIPPMFSAKKVQGQKLYTLARKGVEIVRSPVKIHLQIELLRYEYPELEIQIQCSKGTYIRSLAHDLGTFLGTGAHLSSLTRLRSGSFCLTSALSQSLLEQKEYDISPYLLPC